jgi:hypothetical protein
MNQYLEKLPWKDSCVPYVELTARQAKEICDLIGMRLPRPQYEMYLGNFKRRSLWLMNQGGNLDWAIGASPWGRSQWVLKQI